MSWSGHFVGFMHQLGIYPPPALSAAPGTLVAVASGDPVTAVFNLPAVVITALVTALLVVGIKESATFNAVMVVVKVSVVAIVIAVGVFFIRRRTCTRSFPRTPARSASTAGAASCAARR